MPLYVSGSKEHSLISSNFSVIIHSFPATKSLTADFPSLTITCSYSVWRLSVWPPLVFKGTSSWTAIPLLAPGSTPSSLSTASNADVSTCSFLSVLTITNSESWRVHIGAAHSSPASSSEVGRRVSKFVESCRILLTVFGSYFMIVIRFSWQASRWEEKNETMGYWGRDGVLWAVTDV